MFTFAASLLLKKEKKKEKFKVKERKTKQIREEIKIGFT